MASSETIWVKPTPDKLSVIMSQLVLNAGEQAQGESDNPTNRSETLLALQVTTIREAVRQGGKVALSQDTTTVPPDAELHCYVLTVNALTAAKPNLGAVVVGMNGQVFSPWNDLVKQAREWLAAVRRSFTDANDITPAAPSWPQVTGDRTELVTQTLYDAAASIAVSGLSLGVQYYWAPGQNETSFVCGSTTLTAAGAFYASATSATITGSGASLVFTGSLRKATSTVSLGSNTTIRGKYDLTTPALGCASGLFDPDLGTL